ncbi:hypothetical protein HOK021_16710 [Streptomyces hygroscopicus]|nr:hypothetical protein HOK021_16710 [Streptomyces hygroscopicus]
MHARHGLPRHRPESAYTRPADTTRPQTVNEIRRLHGRIVLAPARTGSSCTGTAGAPDTRTEPAPATTAPDQSAVTHHKSTGCSTRAVVSASPACRNFELTTLDLLNKVEQALTAHFIGKAGPVHEATTKVAACFKRRTPPNNPDCSSASCS